MSQLHSYIYLLKFEYTFYLHLSLCSTQINTQNGVIGVLGIRYRDSQIKEHVIALIPNFIPNWKMNPSICVVFDESKEIDGGKVSLLPSSVWRMFPTPRRHRSSSVSTHWPVVVSKSASCAAAFGAQCEVKRRLE